MDYSDPVGVHCFQMFFADLYQSFPSYPVADPVCLKVLAYSYMLHHNACTWLNLMSFVMYVGTLSQTTCSWTPEDTSSSLILASALVWRSLIVPTFTVISVKLNPLTSVSVLLSNNLINLIKENLRGLQSASELCWLSDRHLLAKFSANFWG
jgi:hypothetical protein